MVERVRGLVLGVKTNERRLGLPVLWCAAGVGAFCIEHDVRCIINPRRAVQLAIAPDLAELMLQKNMPYSSSGTTAYWTIVTEEL